jgi:hypothetical protein
MHTTAEGLNRLPRLLLHEYQRLLTLGELLAIEDFERHELHSSKKRLAELKRIRRSFRKYPPPHPANAARWMWFNHYASGTFSENARACARRLLRKLNEYT